MALKRIATMALAICGVAPAPAVWAAQEHLDTLKNECGVQLSMSSSACACIADKAGAELSDVQQAFVAAQVTRNKPEAGRLQQQMTVAEMMQAGTFMTNAPGACAGR